MINVATVIISKDSYVYAKQTDHFKCKKVGGQEEPVTRSSDINQDQECMN